MLGNARPQGIVNMRASLPDRKKVQSAAIIAFRQSAVSSRSVQPEETTLENAVKIVSTEANQFDFPVADLAGRFLLRVCSWIAGLLGKKEQAVMPIRPIWRLVPTQMHLHSLRISTLGNVCVTCRASARVA